MSDDTINRQMIALFKEMHSLRQIRGNEYIDQLRREHPDEKMLLHYGYSVYSQTDEDGIIEEIFRRVGVSNKKFIEIGAGNGLENNTINLLLDGWSGLWGECDVANVNNINKLYGPLMESGRLRLSRVMVNKDNINKIIADGGQGASIDLLSLDIDGNDYEVLEAVDSVSPRVIVVEYNAMLGKYKDWHMKYDENHVWNGSSYFGASLKAWENLLARWNGGYKLVGCNITGINAFFVKNDLYSEELFVGDCSAEFHYMKNRKYLISSFETNYRKSPELFI